MWLIWLLGIPIVGAAIASLFLYIGRRGSTLLYRARFEVLALAFVAAGLLLSMLVMLAAEGRVFVEDVGFEFSPTARLVLFVVNVSLLCALFVSWNSPTRSDRSWSVWATATTSSLLAGALIAQDGIVSVLFLFGAALVITGSASAIPLSILNTAPHTPPQADEAHILPAKRITGGLKQLAIAVAGTGLLIVGVLLLSRYGLTLENKGLLQLGVGLLSIGLLVRAGAMPFASASADLIDGSPGHAINLLGATTPAAILVGLMLLLPADRSVLTGNSTAWIGAVAVLLAGVRALGIQPPSLKGSLTTEVMPAELVAATVALQVGWAITGALTRSDMGGAGAFLLSLNLALAVPLIIVSARGAGGRWSRIGLVVGVASLLGLPPFGGFAGTLLVAQAAVNLSGFWLAVMLLGSMLVAAKWIVSARAMPWGPSVSEASLAEGSPRLETSLILVIALVVSQVALMILSTSIIGLMNYQLP